MNESVFELIGQTKKNSIARKFVRIVSSDNLENLDCKVNEAIENEMDFFEEGSLEVVDLKFFSFGRMICCIVFSEKC